MSRVFISIKHLVCSCFHILQDGFLRWTRPLNTSLLLGALADLARWKSELVAENALLRQQLIILRRQSKRPVCSKRDRILLVLLAKAVRAWRQALLIVQPETLLRWHRQGFRLFWKQKSKPKSAQAKVSAETCFPPIRRWSSTSPCVPPRCSLLLRMVRRRCFLSSALHPMACASCFLYWRLTRGIALMMSFSPVCSPSR